MPGNREPVLIASAPGGELAVRAGERATLIVEALDPDISIAGAPEAVWLSAAFAAGAERAAPDWLGETVWTAGPSPHARLEHSSWRRPWTQRRGGMRSTSARRTRGA